MTETGYRSPQPTTSPTDPIVLLKTRSFVTLPVVTASATQRPPRSPSEKPVDLLRQLDKSSEGALAKLQAVIDQMGIESRE